MLAASSPMVCFKSHSVREVPASAAAKSVPIDEVLASGGGWSSTGTLARFYSRSVVREPGFSVAVLQPLGS